MNKLENLKTGILCLLILSSVFMSARLWLFDEFYHLRPNPSVTAGPQSEGGYGTLSSAQAASLKGIFSPLCAIYSYGGSRLYQSGSGATESAALIQSEIVRLLSDTETDVVKNLQDKSLYQAAQAGVFCDYDADISLSLYCSAIGVKMPDRAEDMNFCYSGLYLDEDNRTVSLMFKGRTGDIQGFTGRYAEGFAQKVKSLAESGGMKVYFPFEEEVKETVLLPYWIAGESVLFADAKKDDILTKNNIFAADEKSLEYQSAVNSVLNAFLYNQRTIRKYSDDGKTVFVENYSNLSIDKAGRIEYSATQPDKGIPLFSSPGSGAVILTRLDLVQKSALLLSNLTDQVAGGDADIRFCMMEYRQETGGYRIYFQYVYNGLGIGFQESDRINGYPIAIDVDEGYITGALINTGAFYPTGEVRQQPSLYTLSGILNQIQNPSNRKYGICYIEDANGIYKPAGGLY